MLNSLWGRPQAFIHALVSASRVKGIGNGKKTTPGDRSGIENPTCMPHNNNASQALPVEGKKSAKIATHHLRRFIIKLATSAVPAWLSDSFGAPIG